ncbi:hypothetical protein YH65_00815 [Sulfurovum lithotrophicum]|uniref:Nitrous oxide reductase accessory protein NosL n=1 Tax=Sulfurovum lithotrophicum TaxID=206403 RepID=A0A7U4LZL1_9BACT|nr:hypothetical protein [Sulfurovum lithotrophicum]AKF24106.1 hypothetical protein YH65_00815 [Sulfurovum lithotrophicum]
MKKIVINLLTFVVVIAILVILLLSFGNDQGSKYVYKGNTAHKIIKIKPKEYQCSECNMNIEALAYEAQIITQEGNTYFFDDIGCVVLWLKNHKPAIAKIVTQTLDTHHWVDVRKAWYTRIAHDPMGYGFAAYEKKKKGLISYDEMKLLMLQGKNLHDPFVKKKLLGK